MRKKVAFLGAGSHADAILPMLDLINYDFIGFFDDKDIVEHDGYPILGKITDVLDFLESKKLDYVFVTIGENQKRREIFEMIAESHYDCLMNIISRSAVVLSPDSIEGRGIFVGHGAFIGAKVLIKDNSVINTGAVVEHHSEIGAHCNVAPNATINGLTKLSEEVYVGSGAIIIQLKEICPKVVLGAGAVVVKNIVESGTYVGVPARKIKD